MIAYYRIPSSEKPAIPYWLTKGPTFLRKMDRQFENALQCKNMLIHENRQTKYFFDHFYTLNNEILRIQQVENSEYLCLTIRHSMHFNSHKITN